MQLSAGSHSAQGMALGIVKVPCQESGASGADFPDATYSLGFTSPLENEGNQK